MTIYDPKLDPELRNRIQIDELCEQFEENWRAGECPSVFEFAAKHPPELHERLVRELMTVEQRLIGEKRAQEAAENISFEDPSATKNGIEGTAKLHAGMPARIGPYVTKYRLGSGSAGEVYAAVDSTSLEWVALKVPHSFLASNEEGTRRFLREARNAERLKHPNIVRFLHAGRVDSGPYLVYELLNGLDLNSYLKRGYELTSMQIAQLISDACRALQYAHDQGIVHRDLKPSNLMVLLGEPKFSDQKFGAGDANLPLTGHLNIKILDFGIARLLEGGTVLTVDGDILGTPAYMSPEQASGQSNTSDHRSDIYGIGVVLFELLTGSTPFRGTATDVIDRIRREEVPLLSETHPHLPRALATICNRCLRLAPTRRYERIVDVAEDLDRFLSGQTILAKPVGWIESSLSSWKRHQLSRLAIAFGIAVVLCFAFFALIPSKPHIPLARTPIEKWFASPTRPVNTLINLIGDASVEDLVALAHRNRSDIEPLLSRLEELHNSDLEASSIALDALLAHWSPARADEFLRGDKLTQWVSGRVNEENAHLWFQLVEPFRESFRSRLREDYKSDPKNVNIGRSKLLALCFSDDWDSLFTFLSESKPTELDVWREAIRSHGDYDLKRLAIDWKPFEEQANFLNISEMTCIEKSNLVLASYLSGDSESLLEALKSRPDPRVCTYVMHRFADANRDIEPIQKTMRTETRPDVLYGLMVMVALSETRIVRSPDFGDCKKWVMDQYVHHPDAGVHGMCRYLAKAWGLRDQIAEAELRLMEPRPSGSKNWFVDPKGTHFAIIRGPNEFWMGFLKEDKTPLFSMIFPPGRTRIESSYAISMDRIPLDWIPTSEKREPSGLGEQGGKTWYDVLDYCTQRNLEAGFEPFVFDEKYHEFDVKSGNPLGLDSFVGYRLPTSAEWEFASRAFTVTHRFHGTISTEYIEFYLSKKNIFTTNILPNRLGLDRLFDADDLTMSCHPTATPLKIIVRGGGNNMLLEEGRGNCLAAVTVPEGASKTRGVRLVFALP